MTDRPFQTQRFVELMRLSLLRGRGRNGVRLRQQELAEGLGVHAQTVSRWMRGHNRPGDEWIEKLRRFFDWTSDELDSLYESDRRVAGEPDVAFVRWAMAVGFDRNFPALVPFAGASHMAGDGRKHSDGGKDIRRSLYSVKQASVVEEIEVAMGGGPQWVVSKPGHGGSTLAEVAFSTASRRSVIRGTIPILLSLADMLDAGAVAASFSEASAALKTAHPRFGSSYNVDVDWVRREADERALEHFGGATQSAVSRKLRETIWRATTQSLVRDSWHGVLPLRMLAELMGIGQVEEGSDLSQVVEERRRALSTAASTLDEDAGAVESLSGWFGRPRLEELLIFLNSPAMLPRFASVHPIRFQLILDLTPTPLGRLYLGDAHGEYLAQAYIDAARGLWVAAQATWEGLFQPGVDADLGASAYQVLVIAPEGLAEPADFSWRGHVMPPFESGQLSGLLGMVYGRTDELQNLLSTVVTEYAQLSPDKAISTAISELHRRLALDLSAGQLPSTARERALKSGSKQHHSEAEFEDIVNRIFGLLGEFDREDSQLVLDQTLRRLLGERPSRGSASA